MPSKIQKSPQSGHNFGEKKPLAIMFVVIMAVIQKSLANHHKVAIMLLFFVSIFCAWLK